MKELLRSLHSFTSLLGKVTLVASVLFVIISVFSFFIAKDRPVIDERKIIKETRAELYTFFNNKELQKTKTDKQLMALYRVGVCGLIGEGCTNNPNDGDRLMKNSIVGMAGSALAYPFSNPPASGMYWTRQGLENAGFVPKTYAAQGIGFSGLQPLAPLWRLMRDTALLLIVLVVVIIGFLIMFRFKISAQTVVTLENSLPRIVIALILIVFSFPIAGFLIDLMYVVTALAVSLIASNGVYNINAANYHQNLFGGNTGTLFNLVLWNSDALSIGPALFAIMPTAVNIIFRLSLVGVGWIVVSKGWLPNPISEALKTDGEISAPVRIVVSIILALVFSVLAPTLLSLMVIILTGLAVFIRIFIMIFKSYIKLLLRILFSPIILMIDALPGRKMFSSWIKNIAGDLLAVPITVIMAMLSTIIVNLPAGSGTLWQPPFIYTEPARAIYVLVGMGMLYAIPTIHKMAKQFIGIKEQSSGLGLGLFLGGIGGVGQQGMGALSKYSSIAFGMSSLGRSGFLPEKLKKVITQKFPEMGHHP